jgi:hypothetical protein
MFYEAWGPLLERADQVLRLDVREHVADPLARARLDAVALLLSDLGAMWPRLFEALSTETACLARALGTSPPEATCGPDPLQAYRELVGAVNHRAEQARRLPAEQRRDTLAVLREGTIAAARAQAELVEAAASRTADRPGRRI